MAGMDEAAFEPIARAMVEISTDLRAGETALVFYDPGGAPLARRLARLATEIGARVVYLQRDQALEAQVLAAATTLEIEANQRDADPGRRTRLSMSIAGMRFVNSTIDRNFPGSEVFAAPVRDSVEGQLFAAGLYDYDGHRMEDILLRIER